VPFDEQVDAMVAMRDDEGLIGAIGLSNVTTEEYARARAITDVACVQNAYNLADRSEQALLDAGRCHHCHAARSHDRPGGPGLAAAAFAMPAADPRYIVSDAPPGESGQ